ncbi:AAA family ATPase [Lysinibacillus fusiformis]|uniref:AAA family ATPase n=1 Tax=Lysinibacillus fusiformis TaxID=28031 RepID=UPI00301B2E1B
MTPETEKLINELCEIVDSNKYLLLSGATGVGKTFIAMEIAKNCRLSKYNSQGSLVGGKTEYDIETEFISIHRSFSYEDFVAGISITTDGESFDFRYQDKVFLKLLEKANKSWDKGDGKKYFLILDDIGRGNITGILGDMLPLIEPHGSKKYSIKLVEGSDIWIPPNVYIITTQSTSIDSLEPLNYGLLRHFYSRVLLSDYHFMSDDATDVYSDYDTTPNAMFYRSKRVVIENLRHRYHLSPLDREKYIVGHGVFRREAIALTMRLQLIPLLKQYVKDNILDKTARTGIEILENLVTGKYSKDSSLANMNSIQGYRTDVDPDIFYNEHLTHRPIVNLVSRMKSQGLLSDTEIADTILFNPGVLVRKSGKLNGTVRTFSTPAYLYVKRSDRDIYTYGTTQKADGTPKRPRYFYSSNKADILTIDGVEFAAASEMQPKEYTRWSEELDFDSYVNERGSSSPNSIMFRILRSYYKILVRNYDAYLFEFPDDENIKRLRAFSKSEYDKLIQFVKQIGSGSDDAAVNQERNRQFREEISKLVLLWANVGDTISWNGQSIQVGGVYKVDVMEKYKEYSKAMEDLGIHQMIMQGPPGTSKTYSAREYLKFIGKGSENDELLSDTELDDLQIKGYSEGADISDWVSSHPGEIPPIAWDIVQFHPSYGYEDFVRGIEVSTISDIHGVGSRISYDTVNKVLGKIAEVASRPEYKTTKFYLVIDEVNRANLATVFGELIFGLEYRGRSVSTPYTVNNSNKVLLPENLYILGTMNTADKSIGGIDYAIRRRFLFFSLLPDRSTISNYKISDLETESERNEQISVNTKAVRLFDEVEKLFNADNLSSEYYKDDVQIGHTYFMVSTEEQLFLRFKYQILPILREYYKDGMFQFEITDASDDGWNELLECIIGEVSINNDESKIRAVFDKLLKEL